MVAKRRSQQLGGQQQDTDPAILDLEHLRRYTMGSPELERELIGLFLKQLPSLTDELRHACDIKEWRFATHTLKGSARVVGAIGIAEIAELMEDKGRSHATQDIAALESAISAFKAAVAQLEG